MKARPELRYYYRGQIEYGAPRNGKPHYEWREGYSTGEGTTVSYPWMTRRDCRADAKRQGFKAVFYRDGKREEIYSID